MKKKDLTPYNASFELNYITGKYDFCMDGFTYNEEELKELRKFLKKCKNKLKQMNNSTNKGSI